MENKEVMSTGQWITTLLIIFCLPCVNIIMMFVWAFADGNENRKNLSRAWLIIGAIFWIFFFVFAIIFNQTIITILETAGLY